MIGYRYDDGGRAASDRRMNQQERDGDMHMLDALAEANIRDERPSAPDPYPLDPHLWKLDDEGHSIAGENVCLVMRRLMPSFPRWAAERAVREAVERNNAQEMRP